MGKLDSINGVSTLGPLITNLKVTNQTDPSNSNCFHHLYNRQISCDTQMLFINNKKAANEQQRLSEILPRVI